MSDKYNINSYNHVKVEKLDGNSLPVKQGGENTDNNTKLVKVENVKEFTDTDTDSFDESSGDESSYGTESEHESQHESDIMTYDSVGNQSVSSTSTIPPFHQGGKAPSDTESQSSISTTDLLSKDPLFLVLSEFLMNDETGDNIVNVAGDIVKVLSKINSKLGRIADVLEKKHKKNKSRND